MKKTITLIVISLILCSGAYTQQPPDTLWTSTFGGALDDWAYTALPTQDGGFISAGWNGELLTSDAWVVKIDSQGNEEWIKNYGYTDPVRGQDIVETPEGDFVILCNNGLAVQYGYMIKINNSGDTVWTRTLPPGNYVSIKNGNNGGFIIAGDLTNNDDQQILLIRTDSEGNITWTKEFGNFVNTGDDAAKDAQCSPNGGYIIAGLTNTNTTDTLDYNLLLLETDANGNQNWIHYYGLTGLEYIGYKPLTIDEDGNYIITGSTPNTTSGAVDIYCVKTDSDGEMIWANSFDQTGYSANGSSCVVMPDGGILIVGVGGDVPDLNGFLIRTDSNGEFIWSSVYGGPIFDIPVSLYNVNEGGQIMGSITMSYGAGGFDFQFVRLGNEITGIEDYFGNSRILIRQCYPNPFNSTTNIRVVIKESQTISLDIFDLQGLKIKSLCNETYSAGEYNFMWSRENEAGNKVPPGVYFVKLKSGQYSQNIKLIVQE